MCCLMTLNCIDLCLCSTGIEGNGDLLVLGTLNCLCQTVCLPLLYILFTKLVAAGCDSSTFVANASRVPHTQSIQTSPSAENMQSNGWPFNSPVFCAVHGAQFHFQRVKNNSSFMGVNVYECPHCVQDDFAVPE